MKKIFLFLLFLSPCVLFADPGDTTPISTLSPKNYPASFQYITRSTYVFVDTRTFTNNLGPTDLTVQHALQTIDQLSISGGGGGSATMRYEQDGSLAVNTTTTNIISPIKVTSVSGKATIAIDASSVTLKGQNVLTTSTIYVSSANVTNALTVTGNGTAASTPLFGINFSSVVSQSDITKFFYSTGVYVSSVNGNGAVNVTANGTAGAVVNFSLNSSSVTLYGPNIPAASISAGSLGSGVIASSWNASIPITASNLTDSALASGQCVQTGTGGLLTVTGSACGSGGGGASVNVSPHSVLFSTGGTTISGNTGMQYDDSVSSLSVTGGIGDYDQLLLDKPGVSAGFGAARASLIYNPAISAPTINLRTYDTSAISGGFLMSDSNGNQTGFVNIPPQLSGSFQVKLASDSVVGLKTRYIIGSVDGKHTFNKQDGTPMVIFDPVGNSSFTIPVVLGTVLGASSLATDSTGKIIAGSGGGGGSSVSAFGGIYTSSGNVQQTNISTTPVKLAVFSVNGDSSQTTPSFSSSQITVSTTASFNIFANVVSTGTGSYTQFFWIAVNGSTTVFSCQDTPSARCVFSGVKNLNSGDVVTILTSVNLVGKSTITVTDAQLYVSAVGGSGGEGGGSGTVTSVNAGVNTIVLNPTGPSVTVNVSSSPTFSGAVIFSSNTLGTYFDELFPSGNGKLPGANSPFISNSTNELNAAIYFDDTSTQTFSWTARVHNYDGRPLYADILFHSTATANFVCFGVYTATMTPNTYGASQDSPVYSVVVTTAIALSSPSLQPLMSTVQLTNTTVSNGDKMTLKLERETGGCGNTEAVGFARVDEVFLRE